MHILLFPNDTTFPIFLFYLVTCLLFRTSSSIWNGILLSFLPTPFNFVASDSSVHWLLKYFFVTIFPFTWVIKGVLVIIIPFTWPKPLSPFLSFLFNLLKRCSKHHFDLKCVFFSPFLTNNFPNTRLYYLISFFFFKMSVLTYFKIATTSILLYPFFFLQLTYKLS